MTITVEDRQSLLDIVLMAAGSLEAAVEIAEFNDLSLSCQPSGEIIIPEKYGNSLKLPAGELLPATALEEQNQDCE